jgi:TonB-dependent SusC/RagA subfamily outer membrane receptor
MKKRLMLLLTCLFIGISLVTAQNQKVTGVVISKEDGQPVVGASILVKGTNVGSITDLDGKFVLPKVPSSAKSVVVSFIGMKTAEVALKPTLSIVLESDAKVVSEIVVTAMGVSREKKSLGYAVQEVKSEELTKVGQMNVANSLSGKVAGVQIASTGGAIGASSRITIRGNSSFGSNEPLIVVDGVPIANDQYSNKMNSDGRGGSVDMGSGLYDINPDDIESVSVLKGGSAALYGMRAGKGVILITTKSGKKKDKGITVQYDGNFSVDKVYNIMPLQNKYGQGYLGDEYFYNQAKADGYKGTYQDYAIGGYDSGYGFNYNGVNNQMDESWGPRLDIGLKVPQFNSPYKNGAYTATDWVSHPNNVKDFFTTGYSLNHNVSFATQTEKSSTRVSLGYRDQKGTVPNTDQKRYNGQLKTTMDFNKYVSYDLSMDYTRTESDNLPVTGYGPSNPLQSLLQWFGR